MQQDRIARAKSGGEASTTNPMIVYKGACRIHSRLFSPLTTSGTSRANSDNTILDLNVNISTCRSEQRHETQSKLFRLLPSCSFQ